jgi:hypothetical protein
VFLRQSWPKGQLRYRDKYCSDNKGRAGKWFMKPSASARPAGFKMM